MEVFGVLCTIILLSFKEKPLSRQPVCSGFRTPFTSMLKWLPIERRSENHISNKNPKDINFLKKKFELSPNLCHKIDHS